MTLKKSLSAIAAAVMLLALTACEGGSEKASDLDIKLNGVTVSAPFTVEKLGSDYSVGDANFTIMCKNEIVAGVAFDKNSTESDYKKKRVSSLFSIADGGTKSVSVNGIVTGSTQSEVLKAIGDPWKKEEEPLCFWAYHEDGKPDDDNYLVIFFNDNKVSSIVVKPG